MRKKQWKARAKRAERELRDQKAVNAALGESVKRLRERKGFLVQKHRMLLDDYNELRENLRIATEEKDFRAKKYMELVEKYAQLGREYEELVGE